MNPPQLYLASSSPRRRELLTQIGVSFEVVSQDVMENRLQNEDPVSTVKRLALEKAREGLSNVNSGNIPVLGADTAVVVDGELMGKPVDKNDAIAMLQRLSGRQHQVLSAVAVVGCDDLGQDREAVRISESIVNFSAISDKECIDYWNTGEPVDKAGAYAIQGKAALFIKSIEGSYSGVMGLPLYETGELLHLAGIVILER